MVRRRQEVLDELLVLRGQAGDRAALELLAEKWYPRVAAFTFRLTGREEAAAEVAQEVWLSVARSLRRLKDPTRFRSWLFSIAANKSRDWIRRKQRRRRLSEDLIHEQAGAPSAPAVVDEESPEIDRLRQALASLPTDRRALLSMFYLDRLSVREIAAALSIPTGTVKSRLFHARNRLRQYLEGQQPED
jgi:RNA polymerase sigma-70 factor (ECF subfamily)